MYRQLSIVNNTGEEGGAGRRCEPQWLWHGCGQGKHGGRLGRAAGRAAVVVQGCWQGMLLMGAVWQACEVRKCLTVCDISHTLGGTANCRVNDACNASHSGE